jgi:glutaredoxin-like protein NrdH
MNQEEIQKALQDDIILFGLSTCMWCKKTVRFLDEKNIPYSKIFVDKLGLNEKRMVRDEVQKYNKKLSYPTVKIKDKVVIGYDKEKLNEAIGSI